jgi:hypothetical protein
MAVLMHPKDFTRLPKWLVTASHGVWQVTAQERTWVPYSVRHARQVGASQTACGQFAVGWELYWDMPFTPDETEVCETCAEVVVPGRLDLGASRRLQEAQPSRE